MLGDESPPNPGGIGTGLDERAFEHGVVEIGAGGRGAQIVGDVGLADEPRGLLALGVEGDDLDPAAIGRLGVQVTHGVDESHRCLTTVDDSDAGEHRRDLLRC